MSEFRNQDIQNIFSSMVNSLNQWVFRQSWSRRNEAQPYEPPKRPPYQTYQQNGGQKTPPNGERPPNAYAPPPYQRPPRQRKNANTRPPYQAPPPGARPQQPPYGAPSGRQPYPPNYPYAKPSTPPPAYRTPVNGAPGRPPRPPVPQSPQKHTVVPRKRVGAPLFIAFFVFLAALVFTSFWGNSAVVGIALSLGISGVVFTGVYLGLNRKRLPARATAVEQKKEEDSSVSSGNKEVDKLVADGKRFIKQMQEANVAIADPEISAQIERLEVVTRKIFDFIAENPEKMPQTRKFMNYYLPTTLKLLHSYDRLCSQGVKGDNISATMHEIEGMMHTIVVAFEKQLDLLFQDEAMDIATDIAVMESMLAQEGLTDDFEKQEESPSNHNAGGTTHDK